MEGSGAAPSSRTGEGTGGEGSEEAAIGEEGNRGLCFCEESEGERKRDGIRRRLDSVYKQRRRHGCASCEPCDRKLTVPV